MPGIKRKASQVSGGEKPPKLKKERTSMTVENAKGTVKRKKMLDEPPKLKKIPSSNTPRKIASPGKKSPKKPLPLPRFPTLKPTKAVDPDDDGPDFEFSAPSFYSKSSKTNFTNLKKSSTIKLDSVDTKSNSKIKDSVTPSLSHQATEILPPTLEIEVDPNCTRATDIERKLQKLPSGSVVGKITNLEFDDLILPSDASLAIYEFSDESSSTTFGAGKLTSGSPQSRASAFEVAEYLASADLTKKDEGNVDKAEGDGLPEDESETKEDQNEAAGEDNEGKNEEKAYFDKIENKNDTETNGNTSPMKSPRKVPGGLREIVFSFDTTGSMYNYMEEAGERIRDLVKRLQTDMPGIRLAFMAHGDYYDLSHDRYLIKWIDFGASVEEMAKFFDNLSITHGGDADECYELVLQKVRESLSWTPGSQRSLVVIGDSDPHEPGYKYEQFVNDIDWRVETALLKEMGIRIYGLQVGYRSDFYKQISQMTGGAHLRIDNANFTYDTLMSICMREGNLKLLKSYENEVRKAKKNSEEGGIMDLELERLFSSLKSVEDNKSTKTILKMQKQALKEEKKAKKALQTISESVTENEEPVSKKMKLDKKSPIKIQNKLKTSPSAKILSKAKKLTTMKKLPSLKKSPELNSKDSKSEDILSQSKDAKPCVITPNLKTIKKKTSSLKKSASKLKTSITTKAKKTLLKGKQQVKGQGQTSKETTQKQGKSTKIVVKQAAKTNKKLTTSKAADKAKGKNKSNKKTKSQDTGKATSSTKNEKKPKEKPSEKIQKTQTQKSKGKVTKMKTPAKLNKEKKTLVKKAVVSSENKASKTTKKEQKEKGITKALKASPKPTKPVKKLPREGAPVTKFVMGPLSVLSWDNWSLLITQSKPAIKSEEWKKKSAIGPGYCNDKLYSSDISGAVYEIAVSPPDSSKKYPVYYGIDSLWSCFSSSRVKGEVERIIKAKGSISVRRGTMGKTNDAAFQKAIDFLKANFDYAWDGRRSELKKDGFVIAKAS